MLNRYCECLECDTRYLSSDQLGKVRDENIFTYCSVECESDADIRNSHLKQTFDALDEEEQRKLNIDDTATSSVISQSNSTKTLNEVMKDFANAQKGK